jgi:tetratricopeptide (TPR) repeat protein
MKRTTFVLTAGLGLLALAQWLRGGSGGATAAANAAYRRGDYSQALEGYQKAVQQGEDAATATYNQGAALYRLRQYADAEGRYGSAAGADALHAARSAFDRGNCLFQAGLRGKGGFDGPMLAQASRHYRECLRHEADCPEADKLFADARHNLELAKLLLINAGCCPDCGQKHDEHGQHEESPDGHDAHQDHDGSEDGQGRSVAKDFPGQDTSGQQDGGQQQALSPPKVKQQCPT